MSQEGIVVDDCCHCWRYDRSKERMIDNECRKGMQLQVLENNLGNSSRD